MNEKTACRLFLFRDIDALFLHVMDRTCIRTINNLFKALLNFLYQKRPRNLYMCATDFLTIFTIILNIQIENHF
ncbi:hypothetical protein M2408_004261 [Sphingobacterium sp. BIGb0165]|nr:hypothetical protein [Sphingobacterium sp. BIGb0165]